MVLSKTTCTVQERNQLTNLQQKRRNMGILYKSDLQPPNEFIRGTTESLAVKKDVIKKALKNMKKKASEEDINSVDLMIVSVKFLYKTIKNVSKQRKYSLEQCSYSMNT